MSIDAEPRPTIVPDAAVALAPVQERFHRLRLRQIIGAVAALAVVGGLGAGMVVTGAASTARATSLATGTDNDDAADDDADETTEADAAGAASARLDSAIASFTAGLDPSQAEALATATTGVRLGDLDEAQRAAALAVVRSALSPAGYAQLAAAMEADDELDAAVGGGTGWSSDGYTITLLASPGGTGYFLQFGGRQLAVTAISADGSLVVEPELMG